MSASGSGSHWYKDAVIYQVHVRAFADSNADGIGDFRGLVSKLDYLAELGVTAIWLLPFYPSPLRDDGYDIAQYKAIHPSYGSIRDFRLFLREARARGLRVITELVMNHTSDQHPWFQRARRSPPGSRWRNFYVWSDTPDRYRDARIIFKDFETSNWAFDPVAAQYYWHRFYSHQPDLNFESPDVHQAMFEVVDFWLGLGVDGLRLDAIPYLYEREGTNCENLPQTYEFLKALRGHVDGRFEDRMLLAEANQWPEDAVAYFGNGDACNMAFHFPLMPRMFMATRMEDRFPVVDILQQTPPIPDNAQWAIFLRNHDELTLEMVTDEERDYMYRVYAEDPQARINLGIRRRLAPLLGNNRRLIEMMNGLLFSLPGTPVVYYGDEIGMGDNIYLGDRNGVRTPMQWTPDRNAGFSLANPQKLYLPIIIDPEYHASAVNVEAQQNNPQSLLWWMKRVIGLRNRYRAFGRGTFEFLYPENRKVLAFLRRFEDETILIVANLSRFAQPVELDLSPFRGKAVVEVFGRTDFPQVQDRLYLLTLGPYALAIFSIEQPRIEVFLRPPEAPLPAIETEGTWSRILGDAGARRGLEEALPAYLVTQRWFRSKARRIKAVEIEEAIPVVGLDEEWRDPFGLTLLTLAHVEYTEGDPETYVLPLSWRLLHPSESGPEGIEDHLHTAVARLTTGDGPGLLFDALAEPSFGRALLHAISRRRTLAGTGGKLSTWPTSSFRAVRGPAGSALEPSALQAEQSNTSIVYGDRLVLKLFRKLEPGVNPDLEIGRFLTERAGFPQIPQVAGALEYVSGRPPTTLGILQGYVPNEGDAWRFTLDTLDSYLERVLVRQHDLEEPELPRRPVLLDLAHDRPPALAHELFGTYLESARLLGRRTGELHLALASDESDAAFAPEPFTSHYQRSLFQSMRTLTSQVYRLIRTRQNDIPQVIQILDLEDDIIGRFRAVAETKLEAMRTRIHGDYHLGQVLHTGKDFVIIDFEGEPARPLGERRIKRSPLRDVAGMIRSFHYAAYSSLFGQTLDAVRPDNPAMLEPWVLFWYLWVSGAFLGSYLEAAGDSGLLPKTREGLEVLLESLLLEKAVYELRYELNYRPQWASLPIEGILQLVEAPA